MKNPIPLLKRRATILLIHIFSTEEIHILKLKYETESILQSWSHYYAQTALEVPAPACSKVQYGSLSGFNKGIGFFIADFLLCERNTHFGYSVICAYYSINCAIGEY